MYYIKPCYGLITSFMGRGRVHPIAGVIRAHQGIDIGSASDNRVWAAAAGQVTAVGHTDIAGNFVWIKHGNGQTTNYSHLRRVDVALWQRVEQGQRIGMKGETGGAQGVHLHFEISKGEWKNSFSSKLNPLLYFKDPTTEEIQKILRGLGYDVVIDGIYGEKTITAVALYQRRNGLDIDGKAGRSTYAKLKAEGVQQVAATSQEKKISNTVTLEFSSGTLQKVIETFESSKLQQEMAVNYAAASGYDKGWIDKQKDGTAKNGDLVGLLVLSALKMLKENE